MLPPVPPSISLRFAENVVHLWLFRFSVVCDELVSFPFWILNSKFNYMYCFQSPTDSRLSTDSFSGSPDCMWKENENEIRSLSAAFLLCFILSSRDSCARVRLFLNLFQRGQSERVSPSIALALSSLSFVCCLFSIIKNETGHSSPQNDYIIFRIRYRAVSLIRRWRESWHIRENRTPNDADVTGVLPAAESWTGRPLRWTRCRWSTRSSRCRWRRWRRCRATAAAPRTPGWTAARSTGGSRARAWWPAPSEVSDYSACPSTAGTASWCRRSPPPPPKLLQRRLPRPPPPRCSSDSFAGTWTRADSCGCRYVSSPRARSRSVAGSSASGSRTVDHPFNDKAN